MSGNARTAQLERKASNWRGSQGRDPSEMQPAAWRTCQPGPLAERLQRLPGLVQLEESYLGLYYAKSSKWITKQHVWPVTHFYCLYPRQWPCNPLVFLRGGRGGKGKEERAREKETIWNGQFPLQNSPWKPRQPPKPRPRQQRFLLGFPPLPHAGFPRHRCRLSLKYH